MIHLKCSFEALNTSKSFKLFNSLDFSFNNLFLLTFYEVIDVLVWWLLIIFMIFTFSMIFIKLNFIFNTHLK